MEGVLPEALPAGRTFWQRALRFCGKHCRHCLVLVCTTLPVLLNPAPDPENPLGSLWTHSYSTCLSHACSPSGALLLLKYTLQVLGLLSAEKSAETGPRRWTQKVRHAWRSCDNEQAYRKQPPPERYRDRVYHMPGIVPPWRAAAAVRQLSYSLTSTADFEAGCQAAAERVCMHLHREFSIQFRCESAA